MKKLIVLIILMSLCFSLWGADSTRTRSALETLFGDNVAGNISAQDLRDFLASVFIQTDDDTLDILGEYLDSTGINYLNSLFDTGVTNTEFDYLDGVTSNIQTQFNEVSCSADSSYVSFEVTDSLYASRAVIDTLYGDGSNLTGVASADSSWKRADIDTLFTSYIKSSDGDSSVVYDFIKLSDNSSIKGNEIKGGCMFGGNNSINGVNPQGRAFIFGYSIGSNAKYNFTFGNRIVNNGNYSVLFGVTENPFDPDTLSTDYSFCINDKYNYFGFRTVDPDSSFTVNGNSHFIGTTVIDSILSLAPMDTADIATPVEGMIIWDDSDNKPYGYDGTTWNAFW